MIDLTPLDVRKKAGDFKKILRGYDPQEVEDFLQLAADRLEELVKENLTLQERSERLMQQVGAHEARERAVQEALVMAQKLREDMRVQAERESELARQRAEADVQKSTLRAERVLEDARRALSDLDRRRVLFLRGFRALLERELETVQIEEARVFGDAALEARSDPGSPETQGASRELSHAGEPEAVGSWLSSVLEADGAPAEPGEK
jgi:cell division initiation protein